MPTSLVCLLVTLGLSLVPLSVAQESAADAWAEARLKYQSGDYKSAQELLSSWVSSQEARGIISPEAHYNLGLAHWQLKQPGAASFHFLQSAHLTASPLKTWSTLETLAAIEKDLGIQEGVTDESSFFFGLLVKRDWLTILTMLGFWGMVGAGLMAWLQGRRAYHAARQVAVAPFALLLLAATGFLYRLTLPELAVIDGNTSPQVVVFRGPEEKADTKVIELPSGTIATVGRSEAAFVEILTPVTGWIPRASLRPVTPRS